MLKERLGSHFVAVELPNSAANPDGFGSPHAVLTEHLDPTPGSETQKALEQVLDLFRRKLLV